MVINYNVRSNGFYSVSLAWMKISDYKEVFDLNIFVDGKPLMDEWIRVGSSSRPDVDSSYHSDYGSLYELTKQRAAENGYNIEALELRAGSNISFAARYVEGTVDQNCIYPYVGWVRSSGFFMECAEDCHLYADGTCRICGTAALSAAAESASASEPVTTTASTAPTSYDLVCVFLDEFDHPTL